MLMPIAFDVLDGAIGIVNVCWMFTVTVAVSLDTCDLRVNIKSNWNVYFLLFEK